MSNNRFRKAFEVIKNSRNVLLVGHKRPDGDCLSSICAFSEVLKTLKISYTAFCNDAPAAQFSFLPNIEEVIFIKEKLDYDNFDLVIVFDCGSMSRTCLAEEIKNKHKNQLIIEFDHHPGIDNYADIELRFPDKSSTAEVLYEFFTSCNVRITKKIANCLLTGIMTDTGNFLYPCTSDRTITIASKLLLHGAKYPQVIDNTWRNKSLAGMKLWGEAINNLEVNEKYNIAFSVITKENLKESGANKDDIDGIVGFLCNLHGVKGLMLLREEDNGVIKGSLRCNHPTLDISKLAKALGGGGHPKACGFEVQGRLVKNGANWRIE